MQIGLQQDRNAGPSCRFQSGCLDPAEKYLLDLTDVEKVAFEVITEADWDYISTGFGAIRTGLKSDSVRLALELRGSEYLDPDVTRLIKVGVQVLLTQEAAKREAESKK